MDKNAIRHVFEYEVVLNFQNIFGTERSSGLVYLV